MTEPVPAVPYFCPVCGREVAHLWVWQQPGGDRVRIFCEECSASEQYASLPVEERALLGLDQFNAWAGRRQLHHVFDKERRMSGTDISGLDA